MLKLATIFTTLLLILSAVTGCSITFRSQDSLVSRLTGRGPVALSTENPYLPANLLLAKEMDRSADLRGFIQFRGPPSALAVESGMMGPLTIALYYPQKHQVYTLETLGNTWYISDPATMDSDTSRIVNSVTSGMRGDPVLLSGAELAESTGMPLPPQPPPGETGLAIKAPPNAAVVSGAFTSPQQALASPTPITTPVENPPLQKPPSKSRPLQTPAPINANSEYEFLVALAARAPDIKAEITPKGDLVHYVTFPGETLEAITRWFTFDAANTARIRRINQLPATGLAQGDQVIIPAYLIKNKKRLDQASLQELLKGPAA